MQWCTKNQVTKMWYITLTQTQHRITFSIWIWKTVGKTQCWGVWWNIFIKHWAAQDCKLYCILSSTLKNIYPSMFRIFAALLFFFFPLLILFWLNILVLAPLPAPCHPVKKKILETPLPVGCENRLTFFRHISCVKSLTLEAPTVKAFDHCKCEVSSNYVG